MTVKVMGYQPVSFTDSGTGQLVEGTSVYYLYDDMNVTGQVAAKKFLRKDFRLPEMYIGRDYIMEFGPKGGLISFMLAPLPGTAGKV